jgi:hypothetical protein
MEGGHSDTILKGTHIRTIPARLGLIWFSGFRVEDLNVEVYDGCLCKLKSEELEIDPFYVKNNISNIITLDSSFPKECITKLHRWFLSKFQLIWPNSFRDDFLNWPIINKICLWWPC